MAARLARDDEGMPIAGPERYAGTCDAGCCFASPNEARGHAGEETLASCAEARRPLASRVSA